RKSNRRDRAMDARLRGHDKWRQGIYIPHMPTIKTKICGGKTKEALEAAAKGESYIGFNFYRPSPRYIYPAQAAQLSKLVPPSMKIIMVTVDAEDMLFETIFERFTPDAIQLHGKETPQRAADLKAKWRVPIIRAIPINSAKDFEAVKPFESVTDR